MLKNILSKGGQSTPNLDRHLAPGVVKTFNKELFKSIVNLSEILSETEKGLTKEFYIVDTIDLNKIDEDLLIDNLFSDLTELTKEECYKIIKQSLKVALKETDKSTFQTMEGFIHNLNTMHSRAGAQTPFSSVNFGTDTSPEARMVAKNLLLAIDAGLGNGETAIFPISIFRVKEGINYNPEDPNYDLFKLSCKVSAKRLFPNFSFQDSSFNMEHYNENDPDTEIAYMGCRTRVMANIHDKNNQKTSGRGNLSFTTIPLPRIGIEAKGDIDKFFEILNSRIDLVIAQLLDRFEIQARKKVKNYPFLMGQGVWTGSKDLKPEDEVREVIKNGTLSVGSK